MVGSRLLSLGFCFAAIGCSDDDESRKVACTVDCGSGGSAGSAGSGGRGGSSGATGSGGVAGTSGSGGGSGTAGSGGSAGTAGSAGSAGTEGSAGTAGSAGTDGSGGTAGTGGTSGTGGTGGTGEPKRITLFRSNAPEQGGGMGCYFEFEPGAWTGGSGNCTPQQNTAWEARVLYPLPGATGFEIAWLDKSASPPAALIQVYDAAFAPISTKTPIAASSSSLTIGGYTGDAITWYDETAHTSFYQPLPAGPPVALTNPTAAGSWVVTGLTKSGTGHVLVWGDLGDSGAGFTQSYPGGALVPAPLSTGEVLRSYAVEAGFVYFGWTRDAVSQARVCRIETTMPIPPDVASFVDRFACARSTSSGGHYRNYAFRGD